MHPEDHLNWYTLYILHTCTYILVHIIDIDIYYIIYTIYTTYYIYVALKHFQTDVEMEPEDVLTWYTLYILYTGTYYEDLAMYILDMYMYIYMYIDIYVAMHIFDICIYI